MSEMSTPVSSSVPVEAPAASVGGSEAVTVKSTPIKKKAIKGSEGDKEVVPKVKKQKTEKSEQAKTTGDSEKAAKVSWYALYGAR